jgi:hypothetical protein
MFASMMQITRTTLVKKIWHAALCVNLDQTQVVVQSPGRTTFAEQGSKQVSGIGKEEKRAWTAVVGVSASGDALLLQIVYKGATSVSLPSASAPFRDKAREYGFWFKFNPKNYWSNLKTMEQYFKEILVPYFLRKKVEYGYPTDQACIVQLNVWSVHKSWEFRVLVKRRWPWIVLDYVPGGCTGLWQPCDIGIQRPFKLRILQCQLDNIVKETSSYLEQDNTLPSSLVLDTTIGTLCDCDVRWFVEAFETIQNPALVQKAFECCTVRNFNLSHKSVTSAEAISALYELRNSNPKLWAELNMDGFEQTTILAKAAESEDPYGNAGEEDADDPTMDTSIDPATLITQFILGRTASSSLQPQPQPLGLAEQLDSDDFVIPDLGCGKHKKTQTKRYGQK